MSNCRAAVVLEELGDWLAAESEAGRITPALQDVMEYADWNYVTSSVFVVLTIPQQDFPAGNVQNVSARLLIRACLSESRPKVIQREILNFGKQIVRAINRRSGKIGGATLCLERIRAMAQPREGKEPIHWAEIEYALKFHENFGEQ